MNVLMELTDMIFIHFCELLLMFVSYEILCANFVTLSLRGRKNETTKPPRHQVGTKEITTVPYYSKFKQSLNVSLQFSIQ